MRSGLLTATSAAERWSALPEDDWRRTHPDFQEPALSRNLAVVDELRTIAAELDTSLTELAVAWTLHWPGVTGAIVGARRPSQVDEWVGGASLELDDEVVDRIAGVLRETGAGSGPVRPPVANVR